MTDIIYAQHPHAWRHPNWHRLQLRYFGPDCKLRREKKIEDFILTNGYTRIYHVCDNSVLQQFFKTNSMVSSVEIEQADCAVVTDQRFSRLDVKIMIGKLHCMLQHVDTIYFALNRYYLNANESLRLPDVADNYDVAIVQWLEQELDSTVVNVSEVWREDGSWFTWVIPSCELVIKKN